MEAKGKGKGKKGRGKSVQEEGEGPATTPAPTRWPRITLTHIHLGRYFTSNVGVYVCAAHACVRAFIVHLLVLVTSL